MDTQTEESNSTDCIHVAIRVRPLIARERGCSEISLFTDSEANEVMIKDKDNTRYTYNNVFGIDSTQEEVYNKCIVPLIDKAFEGYNATVLAYGQTGSGKTFTMGTGGVTCSEDEVGVVPRAVTEIFQRKEQIEAANPKNTVVIRIGYIEIYNETVRDLMLTDNEGPKYVSIRTNSKNDVIIVDERVKVVTNTDDVMSYLQKASENRVTGQTAMNACSSRSHAVFTLYIEQELVPDTPTAGEEVEEEEKEMDCRSCKFHFVDLAGSERNTRTNTEGQRMKEGCEINKGLLVLGKVIRALGDEKNKGTKPPYRESQLTRLLIDSVGGNAMTVMIACVSPASDSLNESLGTLRYANSAKNIQNKPVKNVENNIQAMRMEIKRLKEELERVKNNGGDDDMLVGRMKRAIDGAYESRNMISDEKERQALEDRCTNAESDVKRLEEENAALKEQLEEAESHNHMLEAQMEFEIKRIVTKMKNGEWKEDDKIVIGKEERSVQEVNEMNLIAEYKKQIAEYEKSELAKNNRIQELLQLTGEQHQESVKNKMEMIDLRSRTMLEMEVEAANRLKEYIIADRDGTKKEDDDTTNELSTSIADVEKTMGEQTTTLSQQIEVLLSGILLREKKLKELKRQQMEMEAVKGKYMAQVQEMTSNIRKIENEKLQLAKEMEALLYKKTSPTSINSDAMNRQREVLEQRLKSKTEEIQVIKTQKKDLEKTISALKTNSQRITRLTKDIEDMKLQKQSLQRLVEQSQRQHKMQLEEKRKENLLLVKQMKQQSKQINELQKDNKKVDALLHNEMNETLTLRKQLKDIQTSVSMQKRERERYNKEEKQKVLWLEKKLKMQGQKNSQISLLEKQLQQKEDAIQRLKHMISTRDKMREETQLGKRGMTSPSRNDRFQKSLDEEELDHEIAVAEEEVKAKVVSADEIRRVILSKGFDENVVLDQLRSTAADEAREMLCVFYKRIADYKSEIKELQDCLGGKEVFISELQREIQTVQRKNTTQKAQLNRMISQIRDEYETQILELQRTQDKSDASANTLNSSDKVYTLYCYKKKQYACLLDDYLAMQAQRNKWKSKCEQLLLTNDNTSVNSSCNSNGGADSNDLMHSPAGQIEDCGSPRPTSPSHARNAICGSPTASSLSRPVKQDLAELVNSHVIREDMVILSSGKAIDRVQLDRFVNGKKK